jgi:hypothetical protein
MPSSAYPLEKAEDPNRPWVGGNSIKKIIRNNKMIHTWGGLFRNAGGPEKVVRPQGGLRVLFSTRRRMLKKVNIYLNL